MVNVSDATATEATRDLDSYRVDVMPLKQDMASPKSKVDMLLVGVSLLIALRITDKFL